MTVAIFAGLALFTNHEISIPLVLTSLVIQFVTLTTNQFSDGLLALIGAHARDVQRMNLEEIFVANVMYHREARGQ